MQLFGPCSTSKHARLPPCISLSRQLSATYSTLMFSRHVRQAPSARGRDGIMRENWHARLISVIITRYKKNTTKYDRKRNPHTLALEDARSYVAVLVPAGKLRLCIDRQMRVSTIMNTGGCT
eukprot:COSAG02_NODE_5522_length_4260_cov_2.569815_7_plen_122_part_00